MKQILLLELDKITYELPAKKPVTTYDLCYRALPDIHFHLNAKSSIIDAKHAGFKIALAAYGEEARSKEALYALDAFSLFDYFLFIDEFAEGNRECSNKELLEREVTRRFGDQNLYRVEYNDGQILSFK